MTEQQWPGTEIAPAQEENWPGAEVSHGDSFASRFDALSEPQPREGGIMQTVPQGIEMLGTPEGRAKLWQGVTRLPGDIMRGILDQFEIPGRAMTEGVSPEQEIAFGLNTALMRMGGSTKMPGVPRIVIPRSVDEAVALDQQQVRLRP